MIKLNQSAEKRQVTTEKKKEREVKVYDLRDNPKNGYFWNGVWKEVALDD